MKSILKIHRETVIKNNDKSDDGCVSADVSFEGSWHRRGYKSNFGIGAIVQGDTGLVLDYKTASKYCQMCTMKRYQMETGKITHGEYIQWLETHLDCDCDDNFEGSSGAMEAHTAVQMWGRSEKYNLRYVNMLSDGDSSAYTSVKSMNGGSGPYGKNCGRKI